MRYILFNSLSVNSEEAAVVEKTIKELSGGVSVKLWDITKITKETAKGFFDKLKEKDDVVVVGGDGTLNHFVNDVRGVDIKNEVYMYGGGTGNDFLRDLGITDKQLVKITEYIKDLPVVEINGETYEFFNGVGFGIDGMVCSVAEDEIKAGKTNIDYSKIAISCLFTKYKRPNATVVVDGKEYNFKKVWLVSSMNGRFYGGGMMVAPAQQRLDKKVSIVAWHNHAKLPALFGFLNMFKGTHVKDTKHISVFTGNSVEVKFDQPTDLQVDGEVFRAVTSYKVTKK